MTAIVPLSGGAKLPAYLQNRKALATINAEAISHAAGYPVLSIKGKVWTLIKGDEKKVVTRVVDGEEEPAPTVTMAMARVNPKSRVFYMKAYNDSADGDAGKPDCYSNDSIAPAADAREPQAKKCAICPHAAWGSKNTPGQEGKGTACSVNTRVALVDPNHLLDGEKPEPYLLRVPAGSRAGLSDLIKQADSRGIPYNALAVRLGFDPEAPAPKLTYKIVGLLSDAHYEAIGRLYEDDQVKEMVGHKAPAAPAPAEDPLTPAQEATEADLDAAIAGKAAAAPAPAKKPAAAAKAVADQVIARAAKSPRVEATEDDLDSVLGGGAKTVEEDEPAPAPAPAPAKRAAAPAKAPAAAPKPAAKAAATEEDMQGLLGDLDDLLSSTDD